MSALAYAELAPQYARLEAYLLSARAWVAVAPLTAAQTNGASSALNSASWWISRLGPTGDLGRGVMDGTFAASRWVAIANEQGAQIQNAWQAASPSQTDDLIWEVIIVPTAQETAAVVQQAAAATPGVLASLAVLAVVYLVLKVTR